MRLYFFSSFHFVNEAPRRDAPTPTGHRYYNGKYINNICSNAQRLQIEVSFGRTSPHPLLLTGQFFKREHLMGGRASFQLWRTNEKDLNLFSYLCRASIRSLFFLWNRRDVLPKWGQL